MRIALTLLLGALALAGLSGCNHDCDDDDVACSSQCSHCSKAIISCNDCVPAPAPMAVETPCPPTAKAPAPIVAEIQKPAKSVPLNRDDMRIRSEREQRAKMIASVEDGMWKVMALKPKAEDPSGF